MKKRPILPHPTDPTAALVQLAKGRGFAVIDLVDADAVGEYNWCLEASERRRTRYARTGMYRPDGTLHTGMKLHVFLWSLWGKPPERNLDHKDRDGLNCRRVNLRPASQSQNEGNKFIQRNNTSGFRGVERSKGRWRARLVTKPNGGRQVFHLGYFDSPVEAAKAYNRAAREYFGEFAFQNPV